MPIINEGTSCLGAKEGALAKLATRLSQIASRLAGVPLGAELEDIAQELRHESGAFADGTYDDLVKTVARLREEREELRHAFSESLNAAVQRESTMAEKCDKLRQDTDNRIREDLSFALREEAEAARQARAPLVAENRALRHELATEQCTVVALRAEIALRGSRKSSDMESNPRSGRGGTASRTSEGHVKRLSNGLFGGAVDGARRAPDFVRRDFVPTSDTPQPWRLEAKALASSSQSKRPSQELEVPHRTASAPSIC